MQVTEPDIDLPVGNVLTRAGRSRGQGQPKAHRYLRPQGAALPALREARRVRSAHPVPGAE